MSERYLKTSIKLSRTALKEREDGELFFVRHECISWHDYLRRFKDEWNIFRERFFNEGSWVNKR